ncbi:MAG: putative molybdenum carrier protein [Methylococcus sp.]
MNAGSAETPHQIPPDRRAEWLPECIVSGGQTGVDRAALDWAIRHGIPHGGWCPKGRRAEDGPIAETYHLQEAASANYARRTWLNVRDSDATLIFNQGPLEDGTLETVRCAESLHKPYRVLSLDGDNGEAITQGVVAWLKEGRFVRLNIAGPRESERPGIHARVSAVLEHCLQAG